jgi:hypothetical protein
MYVTEMLELIISLFLTGQIRQNVSDSRSVYQIVKI